jgi:hypothetical protein
MIMDGMVAAGAETSEADRLRAALLRPIQFAGKPATIDAVVVGHNVGRDDLFHELKAVGASVYLLGDAFAPRRLVFATRQACALASLMSASEVRAGD